MPVMDDWRMDCPWWIVLWIILRPAMALLSSRSDGRDSAKGALEPNVAGDQWSEKQNTKQTQISFDLQHKV